MAEMLLTMRKAYLIGDGEETEDTLKMLGARMKGVHEVLVNTRSLLPSPLPSTGEV